MHICRVEATGKKFPPNRSRKNLILLYIACWPFIIIGALIALGSVVDTVEWDVFAIGMAVFGFGLLILILGKYFSMARKVSYTVGSEGIFLKSTRGAAAISYADIESVTALKEKQAEEFMLKMRLRMEEGNAAIMRGEGQSTEVFSQLKEAFANQKKSFVPYKFLSVPIMYTGQGKRHGITGVNLPCNCALILLKNGEGFLISPLDTEGFAMEAKKYLPAA